MTTHRIAITVVLVAALAALTLPASCQLLSNEIILTPRAIGMGSAVTAGRNEIEFIVGNPAGLARVESSGGGAYSTISDELDAFAAGGIRGGDISRPAVGFSVLYVKDDVRTFEDTVIGGGVAGQLNDNLALGFSAMHHEARLYGGSSEKGRWAFDLGLQYTVYPEKDDSPVVGVSVNNVLGESIPGTDAGAVFNAGVQFSLDPAGKVDVLADWVDMGDRTELGSRFRAGLEAQVEQKTFVRVGLNDGDGTLGLGYASGSWRVDVGWQSDTDERNDMWVVGASSNF